MRVDTFVASQKRVNRLAFVVLATSLFFLSACAEDPSVLLGSTMGTQYSIKLVDLPSSSNEQQIHIEVERILEHVNRVASTYRDNSELSILNRLTDDVSVSISNDLMTLLQKSQSISEMTGGAFDVTIGASVNAWGFGPVKQDEQPPSDQDSQKAHLSVGYQRLVLDPERKSVRKPLGMFIDLSAIAKGYAVDLIAQYLDRLGVGAYLVEVGGEMRAHGIKANGEPWKVGIEAPQAFDRVVQRVIQVDGAAVASSGNYRNFYQHEGQRIAHTINPKTGKPVSSQLASVTVITENAATADALATALMVMGSERAFSFASEKQLAVFFIEVSADGFRERYTQEFEPYFVP